MLVILCWTVTSLTHPKEPFDACTTKSLPLEEVMPWIDDSNGAVERWRTVSGGDQTVTFRAEPADKWCAKNWCDGER